MLSADVELVVEIGDTKRSMRHFDARDRVADESWDFDQRSFGDKSSRMENRAGRFRCQQYRGAHAHLRR